ncbi:GrpB family protein [Cytobacillus sp. FJAT-54145]|uniref:GrpB family protein n=1 Tax=Cytobacillus spartinae TaxID=3299023 RepID=A0ABW6KIN3_9BACI
MLGLPKGQVFLMPWTEEWEKQFLMEKERILDRLNEKVLIHHIGSTSIKNLSAKPIIDIAIEIEHYEDGVKFISPLEQLGYTFIEDVLPERYYFNKGEPRTHQIHMFQKGNNYLKEHLAFRDYLRTNAKARIEYEELKVKLSQLNSNDKFKYTENKTDFVRSILDKINL